MRTDVLHLRTPAQLVQALDACAVAWGVSRNAAANRLLADAIAARNGELLALLDGLRERFVAPRP